MNNELNIDRIKKDDYQAVIDIWRECFGDSEDFLKVYFKDVIECTSGFKLAENKNIVSDLFMLPFHAKLADVNLKTFFLAGCATIPEARKKDYMKTLIKYTLQYFYDSGVSVTYLHPFKHSFYRKFGYETISYVNRYTYKKPNDKTTANNKVKNFHFFNNIKDVPIEKMHEFYNNKMNEFDNCFIRDDRRFKAWIKLLFADDGKAAVIYGDDETLSSYALLYENDNDSCDIFELVSNNEEKTDDLIKRLPYNEINYFLPSKHNYQDEKNEQFTMMRVINPKIALQQYPLNINEDFIIKINDEFMEKNYNLLVNRNNYNHQISETDGKSDFETDINGLAQLLTGSYPEKTPDLEKKVFKRQNSCFFETY